MTEREVNIFIIFLIWFAVKRYESYRIIRALDRIAKRYT